jgi:hypothetical protein
MVGEQIQLGRHPLEYSHALLAGLVIEREVGEAGVEGGFVGGEALPDLCQLLHHELEIGIHGAQVLLLTGVVEMVLQDGLGSVV